MRKESLIQLIKDMAAVIEKEKQYLTDLDAAIGDGDHGINLARGFSGVVEKLPTVEDKDCATILKTVGMTLVSTVGGASGPLYGTAFMKSGMVLGNKEELTAEDFIKMLDISIDGISQRGKSTQGEKTILDALIPAAEAFKNNYADTGNVPEAFDKAIQAAQEGVEYTKTIIATKGRASYLGERSLGHQDPGATSVTKILECIAQAVKQGA